MKGFLLALCVFSLSLPAHSAEFQQTGTASWYGSENGRCANGERYSASAMTAAHRTLPLGCMIRVTNLGNNRSVVVRVADRGPFCKKRILDISKAAASELQMIRAGTARVKVETLASN